MEHSGRIAPKDKKSTPAISVRTSIDGGHASCSVPMIDTVCRWQKNIAAVLACRDSARRGQLIVPAESWGSGVGAAAGAQRSSFSPILW